MSNIPLYAIPFVLALTINAALTFLVVKMLQKYKNINNTNETKIPERRFLRSGGVPMIVTFLMLLALNQNLVLDFQKLGIIIASAIILFSGIYDDWRSLSWKKQFIVQIAVSLVMVYSGLSVDYIANPFGGREFRLDQIMFHGWSVFGSLFILLWIVGFMNVMNWLDGLDGLAGGVGFIGAITLFLISIGEVVNQPPLGIMAITLSGAILGFLLFNTHPARIIMGTSGSMFLGFMLATLAIFSGGKIATALLVMGFPIIDAAWVIAGRIKSNSSPFKGDIRHIHYRLLERGWSQRKIALFVYIICFFFAITAVLFQNVEKIISLIFLFVIANYFIYKFGSDTKKPEVIDTKRP